MKFYDEHRMADIRERLEKSILQWPAVTSKEMMGCLCDFRGSRFFAFLVTRGIVITKLPEDGRRVLLERMNGEAFEMGGRTVKTWIRVPVSKPSDVSLILPYVKKSYQAASITKKKP